MLNSQSVSHVCMGKDLHGDVRDRLGTLGAKHALGLEKVFLAVRLVLVLVKNVVGEGFFAGGAFEAVAVPRPLPDALPAFGDVLVARHALRDELGEVVLFAVREGPAAVFRVVGHEGPTGL